MFKEPPDREAYPQYYEVIKRPMALSIIRVCMGFIA
jgi:hypothetical protein